MKGKKYWTLLMIAALAIGLTACGGKKAAEEKQSDTPSETKTDAKAEWDAKTEIEHALATLETGDPVPNVEEKTLTLSTHCTELDSNYVYATAFKNAVEKLSDGKMKIAVYGNGQLFGQADALQATQQGTLDIANSDTALLANYNPKASMLDLPYLIKNRDQAVKLVKDEKINKEISAWIEDSGMHLLSFMPLNFRNALMKDMNINSFEGFKGITMRTPEAPHTIAAFRAFEANPTVIPSGEAYTAVQTGVADGLEGHAEYMVLQKFYEVAKNYVQTKHVFTFTDYVMSKKIYDGLSDAQKQVIDRAATAALDVFLNYTDKLFPAMEDKLKTLGVTFTEVDLKPFIESVQSYNDDYIKKNDLKGIYDQVNFYE